jgi:GntR family transcriptional repressor for pyruvate dehydrogenase complex
MSKDLAFSSPYASRAPRPARHSPATPRSPRAFQAIVDRLREDIVNGRRQPGDRLPPEQVLAEHFNVSRPGVREALRVLEIQGLVQVRHGYGGGVFVADLGFTTVLGALQTSFQLGQLHVDELYDMRVLLEPTVARLAVERGGPGLAGQLADNVARAQALLSSGATAFGVNLEFHAILAQAVGNRILGLVMQAMLELVERLHHDYPTNRSVSRRALHDHRELIEAARLHEPDRAGQAMMDHLRGLESQFARIQEQIRRERAVKDQAIAPWRGVRLKSSARKR